MTGTSEPAMGGHAPEPPGSARSPRARATPARARREVPGAARTAPAWATALLDGLRSLEAKVETLAGPSRRRADSGPTAFDVELPTDLDVEDDPLLATICCHREQPYVRQRHEDGSYTIKPFHWDELLSILEPDYELDTGVLAPDTLFQIRRGRLRRDALWVGPRPWDVAIRGRIEEEPRRYRVPMPGLIFVCGEGDGFIAVYAAAERPRPGPTGDRAQLFHAPAFNLHDDGTVCKGNHRFSPDPAAIPGDFFGSYFATEITGRGRSRRHPDRLEDLWRELDGRESYPLDDLLPALTLRELRLWLKGRTPRRQA
jgi:hypothetical protein